jgi:hypothetical protein
VLLLSGLALAEEPEVPDWAEGWKKTWLEAHQKGTLQLSAKLTPRYLGNGRQDVFAVLELRALDFPSGESSPASVALVIDRSASTAGRRLLISRKAALSVIDGLSDRDHLAIISVSDRPQLLSSVPMTPENRERGPVGKARPQPNWSISPQLYAIPRPSNIAESPSRSRDQLCRLRCTNMRPRQRAYHVWFSALTMRWLVMMSSPCCQRRAIAVRKCAST